MDIRANNPVFVIANMIIFAIWYYATCFILKPRLRKGYVVLIWVAFYSAFSLVAPLFHEDYSDVRNTLLVIGNIILFLSMYEGKWYAKILCFVMFFALCLLVEIPFIALFNTNDGVLGIPTVTLIFQYCIYILFNVFLDTAAVLFIRRRKAETPAELSFREYLLFALYPLSLVVLLTAMGNIMGKDSGFVVGYAYLLPLTLLVVLSIGALVIIIRRVLEWARLREEHNYVQQALDSQQVYYGGLVEYYEKLRRQRHDLANHVLAVNLLVSEGRAAEAGAYLNELDGQPERTEEEEVNV